MNKKVCFVTVALSLLAGCSWTDKQIGPNEYEISGYFDFTMKGEVVAEGLKDQARLYCQGLGPNLVPDVYYVTDANRVFNYEANRANATIRFHCVAAK